MDLTECWMKCLRQTVRVLGDTWDPDTLPNSAKQVSSMLREQGAHFRNINQILGGLLSATRNRDFLERHISQNWDKLVHRLDLLIKEDCTAENFTQDESAEDAKVAVVSCLIVAEHARLQLAFWVDEDTEMSEADPKRPIVISEDAEMSEADLRRGHEDGASAVEDHFDSPFSDLSSDEDNSSFSNSSGGEEQPGSHRSASPPTQSSQKSPVEPQKKLLVSRKIRGWQDNAPRDTTSNMYLFMRCLGVLFLRKCARTLFNRAIPDLSEEMMKLAFNVDGLSLDEGTEMVCSTCTVCLCTCVFCVARSNVSSRECWPSLGMWHSLQRQHGSMVDP